MKKVRDEDCIRLLLEFFVNWAHVLKVDQFEWKHPALVFPTIMVDAGSRAASVILQRVMGTEHGLAM